MKRTLEFASHPGNLSLMRNFAREFLAAHPFTETEIDLMVLGLDEACTNIIRYAYEHNQTQPITLTCEREGGLIILRLRDFGKQCDPAQLCARPIDQAKPGGLGLHLIRKAFGSVEYLQKEKGTELVLTKNLPPESITRD